MNKKFLVIIIAAALVIGGGSFWGGIKYWQNKTQGSFQNLRNLSPEERQQRFQQMGTDGKSGNQAGAGLVSGEIISKDDKSVTIKLRDGGSKIVFYSDTTEIDKSANGTSTDLEINKNIAVTGKANQDGSITAQSIQIRPVMPNQ